MRYFNIIFLFRLLLLPLVTFFQSCSNDPEVVKTFINIKELPLETIKEAELLYTEEGNLKVKILAEKIERYADPESYVYFSEGIVVYFFNDSSKVTSKLTAQEAYIDEEKEKMIAKINVELINTSGEKLSTEELIWDDKSQLIYTEEPVQISNRKEVIFGEGFESRPDFTLYKIKNVRGTININDKLDTLK